MTNYKPPITVLTNDLTVLKLHRLSVYATLLGFYIISQFDVSQMDNMLFPWSFNDNYLLFFPLCLVYEINK